MPGRRRHVHAHHVRRRPHGLRAELVAPLVPAVVAERARRRGAQGREWLRALPELVAELGRRWSFTVDAQLEGGNESIVLAVVRADGPAVLKLVPPGTDVAASVRVLTVAAGRGYARLFAHDVPLGAVLLERLGPSLADLGVPPATAVPVLGDLLASAWQPAAGPAGGKAAALAGDVVRRWSASGEPCPRAVVDRALEAARRRAGADPGTSVVVHGDPHPGNALQRPGGGFAFVDPDGFVDDPAYDLGVVVRDWCGWLLAAPDPAAELTGWCHTLAERTGCDPAAIRDWGYLERVSTGLYLLDLGEVDAATPFLRTATLLERAHRP